MTGTTAPPSAPTTASTSGPTVGVHTIRQRIADELGVRPRRSPRPSSCSKGAPRCRSSPATARRPPAASTTPSCAPRGAPGYLRELEDRRDAVLEHPEQGKLDAALERASAADTKARLEDLYLPFSRSGAPRRRSPGSRARAAGRAPARRPDRTRPGQPAPATSSREASPTPRPRSRRPRDPGRALRRGADLIGGLRERIGRAAAMSTVAPARRPRARSSPTTSTSPSLPKLPSHRILALFRGEKEEILDVDLDAERRRSADRPAAPATSAGSPRRRIPDERPAADAWLAESPLDLAHAHAAAPRASTCARGCASAPRRRRSGLRGQPARSAARRARRQRVDDRSRSGLPHRRQGRRRRRTGKVRRHRHDLPARAAPRLGRALRDAARSPRRTASSWSRSATARRRARRRSSRASSSSGNPSSKRSQVVVSRGRRVGVFGVGVRVGRSCPTSTSRCAARSRSPGACRTRSPSS